MHPVVKEASYVCIPSTISINMKYSVKLNSVKIYFNIYNKEAFYLRYRFSATSKTKDYDEFLEYICNMLFDNDMVDIDAFTDLLSDDDCLKGEYIYKNLKNVKKKSGATIWPR